MDEEARREELTELSIQDLIDILRSRYELDTGLTGCTDEMYIRQALVSSIIDTED